MRGLCDKIKKEYIDIYYKQFQSCRPSFVWKHAYPICLTNCGPLEIWEASLPKGNLVLSTELITQIDHRKELKSRRFERRPSH